MHLKTGLVLQTLCVFVYTGIQQTCAVKNDLLRGRGGLDVERVVGLLLLPDFSPLGEQKKSSIN